MGLKFCNQLLEADASLKGLELKSLYDNMKYATWTVLASLKSEGDRVVRVSSGVSIDQRGLIITSSFHLDRANQIRVRGFKDDTFIPATRVSFVGDKYGLALLRTNQECDFARIVNDTNLIAGRDVYAISHVLSHYKFTFMTGNLVSPLRKKDQIGIKVPELDDFFLEAIDPEVQLLTICGFNSHLNNVVGMQALGAPVFNSKGQVIGVIVASDRGFEYAVPSRYFANTRNK